VKLITKRLKALRFERGINQRDVAEAINVPLNRYWEIENGYRVPDDRELARLARVLKCEPSDILPSEQPASAS
jgi:transcriptional regulator with XRE-family HTH domain